VTGLRRESTSEARRREVMSVGMSVYNSILREFWGEAIRDWLTGTTREFRRASARHSAIERWNKTGVMGGRVSVGGVGG
jgi:hypothetical protein